MYIYIYNYINMYICFIFVCLSIHYYREQFQIDFGCPEALSRITFDTNIFGLLVLIRRHIDRYSIFYIRYYIVYLNTKY